MCKTVFLKIVYPENILKKCFKRSINNIHIVKETTLTAKKKSLDLVLPFVVSISLVQCCDSVIVILVPYFFSSLKLENGMKKHVRSVTKIKYDFVKLVVIFFLLFGRDDYVIPSVETI